jgi:hypothetical protein
MNIAHYGVHSVVQPVIQNSISGYTEQGKINGLESASFGTQKEIRVGTNTVWHSGNFDPNGKANTTGTYALRATGTTKSDVGLGSVRNVGSYSQAESNGRYLSKNGGQITGALELNERWSSSSLASNAIYNAENGRGFALGNGSSLSTWFSYNGTVRRGIDVWNDGSKVRITPPLKLAGGITGNVLVDNGKSTNLTVRSNSDGVASVNAEGGGQGTGVLYAGQTLDHGGGIFYNGDGSPSYANGDAADRVSLFRRSGGTNHVVMSYSHSSSDVSFTGNVTASGNITAYSDKRLKKDLVVIPTATDKVKQLAGYTYTNINNGSRNTGVVAQEVQKVLPEAVHEDDKGMLSVAYGNMIGLLIESIKEQQTQIDELKRRIG